MPPRSLTASPEGVKRARRALERRSLNQTDFMEQSGIATWSTINKFFTGKPVSRSHFKEICLALDLEWQEIAATPNIGEPEEEEETDTGTSDNEETSTNTSSPTFTWEAVQHCATRTRAALDPYILPLVRRDALLEKCLKHIKAGLQEAKRRVVPITGAAGYGKSTILGNLYDELYQNIVETGTGWIALARCDDFIESLDSFALELGEKVSGTRVSIIELAKQLNSERERGVLLLDTLDIVLTKPLVPVLRSIFYELLATGTTIVFTCRDSDYSNFFEPYHESFAGFRESVQDGCKIPPFNEEEVKIAAREFGRLKLNLATPESQQDFAEKISTLSADSKSIQAIVCHPLLLALLCDLFASEGTVPEDLTVSQLYEQYWNWKIAKVRYNLQSSYLGRTQEILCLKIAEFLYKNSEDRLRDFIYETTLELNSEAETLAYNALVSEGILKNLGGKRWGFFHQTFLEYAIARWLSGTDAGETAKLQLKSDLSAHQNLEGKSYIWPVFRQLLTLISFEEFIETSDSLDCTQILPFRAVVFAAVSRSESNSSVILRPLLQIALNKDYSFQETLLAAANGAPNRHGESVWQSTIHLLASVGKELINKAVETTAELLVRLQDSQTARFEQALGTIKNSAWMLSAKTLDDKYHIWGQFFSIYCDRLQLKKAPIETGILSLLKEYYPLFGSKARAMVIGIYLAPEVPQALQQDFLTAILPIPPANNSFFEKANATELFKKLLPDAIAAGNTIFGGSWFEALHAPEAEHWTVALAGAIGDHAISDLALATQILSSLLGNLPEATSKEFNRRNTIAAQEMIAQGGGNLVASILMSIPPNHIPRNRISTLSTLLKTLAEPGLETCQVTEENQLALVKWIMPLATQYPVEIVGIIDAFAKNSVAVQQVLGELLSSLILQTSTKDINKILQKLNYIPTQLEPYLRQTTNSKESRAALLRLYQQQVSGSTSDSNSEEIISEIMKFCSDNSNDVAKEASWIILEFSHQQKLINPQALLEAIAISPVVSVRQNCLKAFIELVNLKRVSQVQILQVFETLISENASEVLQLLYQLANAAIWNHPSGTRAIELPIADAVFKLTQSLLENYKKDQLDMVAAPALLNLNQMSLLEDRRLVNKIGESLRNLLRKVDTRGKVDKRMITGLLNNIAKFEPNFLESIIREDFFADGQMMAIANQQAVAIAISHNMGKNSPLLDDILMNPDVSEEVKNIIRRERGI